MKKLVYFTIVFALTGLHCAKAAPASADKSGVQLTIDLRDGSRLAGKPLDDSVSLHSTGMGDLKLRWAQIRSIEYSGTNGMVRLTATNGDLFSAQLAAETLSVETSFGKTEVPSSMIRHLTVLASGNLPAALGSEGKPELRLTIELRDGSQVVGKGLDETLNFQSSGMGDLKLTWPEIRSIDCASTNSGGARLTTTNGDVFAVQFAMLSLRMETGFGKVELPVSNIRKLTVSSNAATVPQREGLIGFWPGNGTADDVVGGDNGLMMGGADFAPGLLGSAFHFDAPGSYVKVPQTPALNPANSVSIECWMNADPANHMDSYQGLATTDFYGLGISNGRGGRMGVNFFISTTANRPVFFGDGNGLRTSSGITTVANFTHISDANGGGAPISAGQWHHVAATYDGAQMRLYIDGQPWGNPISHAGRISPMLSNSFLAIGSEDGRTTGPECIGTRYFKGSIGGVALYNRALSAKEIHEDYEAGNQK